MLQTVAPTEHESVASTPAPSPPSKPKATIAAGSSSSSLQQVKKTVVSSVVKHSLPTPSLKPSGLSSSHETDAPAQASDDSSLTQTTDSVEESDSWLTTFASRKTLLVLLALVAGLAIFFPRGDDTMSEQGTSLLVDESGPEPTVVPFEIERYPATRLESPIASATTPMVPRQQFADPAKVIPPSPVLTASVPLRQPVANPAQNRIASVVQEPLGTIPQPPKTPWDEQPVADRTESFPNSPGSLDEALSFAQAGPASSFEQTLAPQSPVIEPFQSSDIANTMDSAQPQVNENGGSPAVSDANVEAPARLVNSRTPQGIFNWKKFLPPINEDSASVSTASPGGTQNVSMSPAVPDIRTSAAPVAPSFEFALPDGTNPAYSDAADSPDSIQSNPNGSTAMGPEARVAMPPQPSLR